MIDSATDDGSGGARFYRTARVLAAAIPLLAAPAAAWCSALEAGETLPNTASNAETLAKLGEAERILFELDDTTAIDLDTQAQSEATLAETIQDNEAIRRILRGIILPAEPTAAVTETGPGARSLTPASDATVPGARGAYARQASGLADNTTQQDASDELTFDETNGGLTLGDVLRSVIKRAKGTAATAGATSEDADDDTVDDGGDLSIFDLRQSVLKSRLLGLALESIIEVSPTDNSFSVFGMGRFTITLSPDDHNAVVTEASSNTSIDVGSNPRPGQPPRGQMGEKLSLLGLMRHFLDTSVGMVSAVLAGCVLLMWGTARIASAMRRT